MTAPECVDRHGRGSRVEVRSVFGKRLGPFAMDDIEEVPGLVNSAEAAVCGGPGDDETPGGIRQRIKLLDADPQEAAQRTRCAAWETKIRLVDVTSLVG